MLTQSTPPLPLLGELAALSAALIWAGSMSVWAGFGRGFGALSLNLFKTSVAAVGLSALALTQSGPWPLEWGTYLALALSGILGLGLGDLAMFSALQRIGAQRAAAIQCLSPPLAAVLATALFGETLSRRETAGMTLTVVAVLTGVMLARSMQGEEPSHRSSRDWLWGSSAAVVAALCQALAIVLSRGALQQIDVFRGTLLRILPAIAVLMVVAARRHGVKDELKALVRDPRRARWIFGAAVTGTGIGLLLLSTSAKYAKAGVATALSSTYPIWIIPIARIYLREESSRLGSLLTIVAVVGVALMLV